MVLRDIIVAIVAAIVVALFTWGCSRAKKWLTKRHIRAFWDFTKGEHLLIVFPKTQHLGDHDTGKTAERSLNLHSAVSLECVDKLLSELGMKTKLIPGDNKLRHQDKGDNLVLIGGTLGNEACMDVCSSIKEKLYVYWFGKPKSEEDHFLSNKDGALFKTVFHVSENNVSEQENKDSEKLEKGVIECDHGLVLKFANPFNPKAKVIVVAGNYGAGTLAAARAATDNQILSKVSKNVDLKGNIGFVVKGYPRDFVLNKYELEGLPFKIKGLSE